MNILVSGLFSAADSYGKSTAVTEIIIMLLVAFILGYLLRYFLTANRKGDEWESKYRDLDSQHRLLEKRFATLQKENRVLMKDLDECVSKLKKEGAAGYGLVSEPTEPAKPARKDDLTKIEGIGPKIRDLLYAAGIYTFAQLADTDTGKLEAILEAAGPRFRVHTPQSWPLQARMAADKRWDELKKWQDRHKYGRL